MGNDGGSIPKRRELVKEAARNPTTSQLKETQKEQLAHRWSMCPISHRPLAKPIVSDCEGNLYNKDAIIQYLLPADASSLDKDESDKFVQGRVRGLKDVVEVHFEIALGRKDSERWICPVTLKELGPTVKAVYLVPCGHAFSLEAMKEMKGEQCIQCDHSCESRDILPILPMTEEERDVMRKRMVALAELGLAHSLKKASGSGKKRKVTDLKEKSAKSREEVPKAEIQNKSSSLKDHLVNHRSGTPQSGTSTPRNPNGIKNAATASLTAKVLEEEEARKKRRVLAGENENLNSLFTKAGGDKYRKNGDFMTRGFSISANAKYQ